MACSLLSIKIPSKCVPLRFFFRDESFIKRDIHLSGQCITCMQFEGSHKCPEQKKNRKKTKTFITAAVFVVAAAAVQNKKKSTHMQIDLIFGLILPLNVQNLCKLASQSPN